MCEAFNLSILEARNKSIITMLEEIRVKIMTRIVVKREFCNQWNNGYGPLVKAKFDKQKKNGVEWRVVWNGDKGCEVKKGRRQYIVKIKKRECSCRLWQISGIPCAHACCAIWHDGGNPDNYIDKWYSPQMYMKAYQHSLQPINGPHEWKKSQLISQLCHLYLGRLLGGLRKIEERVKMNREKSLGNLVSQDPL
ncbi:hypothetical protein DITRI_Ditri06bG0055400 [Diplodiscus trichospermus]